ncbi:NTF2-related export protein [Nilaparvata lugens]|uniref:NTF2-related export protein n=1 Tax=Nilaparvata lugens TaxID=108931 RepID=UPI00193DDA2E|nr:NTF2-related export protein [Nilaparvata lugens]
MSRLYQDTAILVWNGNGILGKEEIQKFLSDLPTCDHSVRVLDSQKILDSAVSNQLAYAILATGTVKYTGKPMKQFAENFIITAEGERWKIVSDSFRFQEFVSKDVA